MVYSPPVDSKELQDFIDHRRMDDEEKLAKFLREHFNVLSFEFGLMKKQDPAYGFARMMPVCKVGMCAVQSHN